MGPIKSGRRAAAGRAPRRILALLASMAVAVALVGGTPSPAAATSGNFLWATNTITTGQTVGGCRTRIQYGNFGSDAYGFVRLYSGSCAELIFYITVADSSGTHNVSTGTWTTGTDGCGSYYEKFITQPDAYVLSASAHRTPDHFKVSFSAAIPPPYTGAC
jgi:hypothetical protein